MRIPGKEEFAETIRYFTRRLDLTGVKVHLGRRVEADELVEAGFTEVVVATGVSPRMPAIPGIEHPMVMTYAELVRGERTAGPAGGRHRRRRHRRRRRASSSPPSTPPPSTSTRGAPSGASATRPRPGRPAPAAARAERRGRSCCCSARRSSIGRGLGKTSGWVHRAALQGQGRRAGDRCRVVRPDRRRGPARHRRPGPGKDAGRRAATEQRTFAVDSVVVCAGQESVRTVADALEERGLTDARHRRCRRGGRARRQARHPPGHRGRRPHLTAAPETSGARHADRRAPAISVSWDLVAPGEPPGRRARHQNLHLRTTTEVVRR